MNNQSEFTRLIDIAAERSVIGSCMMDPKALTRISSILSPADFYREANQYIFEAMQALADQQKPVDPITLVDELNRRNRLDDAGGMTEIQMIAFDVPSAMHVEHYAKIVADKATMRRLNIAASKIAQAVFEDDATAESAVDNAERIVFDVTQSRKKRAMEQIADPLRRMIASLEATNTPAGIPTGFSMLDRILGGLQRSDLIILAARPGMGKSSAALGIGLNAALKGNSVAMFSLEMSKDQFTQRLISMRTKIDSHRIRMKQIHDDEWPTVLEAANELSQAPIHIDDTAGVSVDYVRRESRRLQSENGLDLIIVDYLQLLTGKTDKNNNREQEIAYISRSLKAMAKELDVPVIALSQLNRGVETRADKRPTLADLRESGSIEQDADDVIFIYRDDYYHEDSDEPNIAEFIIAKHRHGSTGTIKLFFRKELTEFRDLVIERTDLEYEY